MSIVDIIKINSEKEISIADMVLEQFQERSVQAPLEEDEWIRVSSIGSLCEREEVLCSIKKINRNRFIDGDSGMNFQHGHAVHWMFQSRVLPHLGMIIGSWRCTYCGTTYGSREVGYVPRPNRCFRCGAIAGERPRSSGRPDLEVDDDAFVFVEQWFGNEEYKIGGSPDGQMMAVYNPNYRLEDLTLLEFKSCNDNSFKKVSESPDFVHVIQAQLYLWLTGIRKVKVIYFNKNDRGTKGLREYDLPYDQECIDRVLSSIKSIRDGIASKKAPPRVICADIDCPRAKKCKISNICFSE